MRHRLQIQFLFITLFHLTRTREESFLLCCNFTTFLTFTHPHLNIYGDSLCLLIRTCVILIFGCAYSRYDFSKNQLVAIVVIQLWIDAFMIAMISFQLLRSEFCHDVIALL